MLHSVAGLLLCLTVASVQALDWTSGSTLINGSTIPVCPGQDVTLAWGFTVAPDEHVMNVEWHYTAPDHDDAVLATQVMGTFFAAPGISQQVEFVPQAGVRLLNVGVGDSGTYSVHVNINLHGSMITEVQAANVHVSDAPLTTDGQLYVSILPDAKYDNSTQEFHIQLTCGEFKAEWEQKAKVVWKSPTNQTLTSSYDNGFFFLSVPNPVVSGQYSCVFDNTSVASLCVQSDSPLRKGAAVNVDGVQAQMAVLSTRMHQLEYAHKQEVTSLQQKNANLTLQVNKLTHYSTVLTEEQIRAAEHMERLENSCQQEIASLKQENAVILAKLDMAARDVSFHVQVSSLVSYNPGSALVASTVFTNIGGAFKAASGVFTAPVNGSYIFMANVVGDAARDVLNRVQLVVDGSNVVSECITSSSHLAITGAYHQGGCDAVLSLKAGQHVWLRVSPTDTTFAPLRPGPVSTFSGALLHADLP